MGLTHEVLVVEIESLVADPVVGTPVRVGGHALDIHFMLPVASLIGMEGSNDRTTWHPLTDADGADINGPTAAIAVDDYREVRERPEWIRPICEPDAGGPRVHRALVGVHKITS
jgi:hypothetical protein